MCETGLNQVECIDLTVSHIDNGYKLFKEINDLTTFTFNRAIMK